jgi:anti-sigma factor RsiW
MDALLFHPKVVHIPMALGVLMPLIASGLALAWWRGWLPWRGWIVAVGLQAVLLVSGVVALRTGEAEEERVERIVSESLIEAHEEAAEVFVWSSGAVLAIMLAAAAFGQKRSGLPIAAVATLGTLVVLGLGYRTGQAGGSLVYEYGAAQAYGTSGASDTRTAPARRADDD